MYSFFIGSDVSKSKIDVAFREKEKATYLGEFKNNPEGFRNMVRALRKETRLPKETWVLCFENTGSYSKGLLEWLFSQGIPCVEECPLKIKRSLGLKRGKDDKADSKAICTYVFEKRDSICPSKPDKPLISKLKQLITARAQYVRYRTGILTIMKEIDVPLTVGSHDNIKNMHEELVVKYDEFIKELEIEIKATISADSSMKKNSVLVQSVIGIGPITSAFMIATTDNFQSFSDSRKYACYCGVAPFPNSSGVFQGKTKVSHMANKTLKGLLGNGAWAAIQHDPDISTYYNKKKAEGKPSGVILNAIKNKIIHRAFAVINRQAPYVKIMRYAS
jgi:transposase